MVNLFIVCSSFQKGSVHPFLCQKILAALSDDPEDDYAPIFCKMLSDIDANDWMDITQINALIADTDDVIDVSRNTFEAICRFLQLTISI